jgi:hypothetical protein
MLERSVAQAITLTSWPDLTFRLFVPFCACTERTEWNPAHDSADSGSPSANLVATTVDGGTRHTGIGTLPSQRSGVRTPAEMPRCRDALCAHLRVAWPRSSRIGGCVGLDRVGANRLGTCRIWRTKVWSPLRRTCWRLERSVLPPASRDRDQWYVCPQRLLAASFESRAVRRSSGEP